MSTQRVKPKRPTARAHASHSARAASARAHHVRDHCATLKLCTPHTQARARALTRAIRVKQIKGLADLLLLLLGEGYSPRARAAR